MSTRGRDRARARRESAPASPRQRQRRDRQREQRRDRERPDQMARRRRRAAAQQHVGERRAAASSADAWTKRSSRERAHRLPPCSRPRLRSALSRLYSSSDSGSPAMSSSAAAADPGESSKNVRTSCFSAERLASSGVAAGEVDEARPVVLAAEQAAVDHDLEQLAHAGRARRVGQLGADLFDGRAAAAVEDFHDLRFAAGEVGWTGRGTRRAPGRRGEKIRAQRIYSRHGALSSATDPIVRPTSTVYHFG